MGKWETDEQSTGLPPPSARRKKDIVQQIKQVNTIFKKRMFKLLNKTNCFLTPLSSCWNHPNLHTNNEYAN